MLCLLVFLLCFVCFFLLAFAIGMFTTAIFHIFKVQPSLIPVLIFGIGAMGGLLAICGDALLALEPSYTTKLIAGALWCGLFLFGLSRGEDMARIEFGNGKEKRER